MCVCVLTYCVLGVHGLAVLAEALLLSCLHGQELAEFVDTAAAVLLHLLPAAAAELHAEHAALALLGTTGKQISLESPPAAWSKPMLVGDEKKAIDLWITVPI